MRLVAITLVPTSADRWHLTPDALRDTLMGLRDPADRIEHIRVVERAGLLWVGAYVSTAEEVTAQRSLSALYERLLETVGGWDVISDPGG